MSFKCTLGMHDWLVTERKNPYATIVLTPEEKRKYPLVKERTRTYSLEWGQPVEDKICRNCEKLSLEIAKYRKNLLDAKEKVLAHNAILSEKVKTMNSIQARMDNL